MKVKGIMTISCLFLVSTVFSQIFDRIEEKIGLIQLDNTMGVSVADYDGDQDLDLFVVAKKDYDSDTLTTWSRLFRNNNDGTFDDVTIEAGFNNLYDYNEPDPGWQYGVKMGASWGDYDNDGFPDLFLTNYHRVQLFHNEGDGTFEEVTEMAGFPVQDSCYNTTALWWDTNKDGWLDLYVSRWGGCPQNRFYKNNGDGTFTNQTEELGIGSRYSETWMTLPIDANQDGHWDLYLANDFRPNELFMQNPDGTFTNQALSYKVSFDGNEMGMAIGDYNNDGDFDIYIANIGVNRLLTPNDNTYKDLAHTQKVVFTYWAWATQFTDFDLDGDEDLFVTNGYQNDQIFFSVRKENFLFKNLLIEGQTGFEDWSAENKVNEFSNSMGLCVFDYDNDGDQDAFISNMDAPPYFYKNLAANDDSNDNNWINIHLEGTVSNRDGLGSQLTIWTNGQAQHRLNYGANLFAQNLQPVHFGLGTATKIDSLAIQWDLGTKELFYDLPINQHFLIKELEALTILDLNNPTTSTTNLFDKPALNIYPNPINGSNQLTIQNTSSEMNFRVINLHGQEMEFNIVSKSNNQTILDFPNLHPGIYFILSDKQSWKIVVQ